MCRGVWVCRGVSYVFRSSAYVPSLGLGSGLGFSLGLGLGLGLGLAHLLQMVLLLQGIVLSAARHGGGRRGAPRRALHGTSGAQGGIAAGAGAGELD